MKQYDIYKSEGGYRVAAEMAYDWPEHRSSPWFPNRGLAASWRMRRLKKALQRTFALEYPKSYKDQDIKYLRDLISRPQKH